MPMFWSISSELEDKAAFRVVGISNRENLMSVLRFKLKEKFLESFRHSSGKKQEKSLAIHVPIALESGKSRKWCKIHCVLSIWRRDDACPGWLFAYLSSGGRFQCWSRWTTEFYHNCNRFKPTQHCQNPLLMPLAKYQYQLAIVRLDRVIIKSPHESRLTFHELTGDHNECFLLNVWIIRHDQRWWKIE